MPATTPVGTATAAAVTTSAAPTGVFRRCALGSSAAATRPAECTCRGLACLRRDERYFADQPSTARSLKSVEATGDRLRTGAGAAERNDADLDRGEFAATVGFQQVVMHVRDQRWARRAGFACCDEADEFPPDHRLAGRIEQRTGDGDFAPC